MPDFPVPQFATDCVHYTTRVVNYSPGIHISAWYNAGSHAVVPECDIPTNNDMFRRPIATPCDGCPYYEHRVDQRAAGHFRILSTSATDEWVIEGSGIATYDGVYTLAGSYHGYPYYTNADGRYLSYYTYLGQNRWVLGSAVNAGAAYYGSVTPDLPANAWSAVGLGDTPPVGDEYLERWGLDASGFEVRELPASAAAGDRPYSVGNPAFTEVGSGTSLPVYANLCLDRSESVEDWMGTIRDSARVWVERQWGLSDAADSRPDRTGIFSFGATGSHELALSSDRDDLTVAIDSVECVSDRDPGELTDMLDSIQAALDDIILNGQAGCNAVVVIGDGVDTCSTATAAGIIAAAGAAGVPIHAVEIVGSLSPTSTLYELTSGTGGQIATGVVGFTGVIDFFDAIQRAGHRHYYAAAWDTKAAVAEACGYCISHGSLVATGRQYGGVV